MIMLYKGRLHSIESMGTADGPGIRTVIFLQGCPLRCLYCHNPDTWNTAGGEIISSADLFSRILRYRPYYGLTGGITLSGGEPLAQPLFCASLMKMCRESGINTCLDTAGSIFNEDIVSALNFADLIILDVKHTNPDAYKKLTGGNYDTFEKFLNYCISARKPLWLRQVIVPGITDSLDNIKNLISIAKKAKATKVELLPYHVMGIYKWNKMGLKYPLKNIEPPSEETMQKLRLEIEKSL